MRSSRSVGGVRKQQGRWVGLWREDGVKKSRVLGLCKGMTKGEARTAVSKIVGGLRKNGSQAWLGPFVEQTLRSLIRPGPLRSSNLAHLGY